jgi:hypothetical protein
MTSTKKAKRPSKRKLLSQWAFEYLPWAAQNGREIPCFRIFPEEAPEDYIADTNEHLPRDIQEANACLIASAPQLLKAAVRVVSRWEKGDLAEAVRELNAAIATAKGYAP